MQFLIINTDINRGGIGSYTVNLAEIILKIPNAKVSVITTHRDPLNHNPNSKHLQPYIINTSHRFPLIRYLKTIFRIRLLRPDFIFINNNKLAHNILPILGRGVIYSVIHSDDMIFYKTALVNKKNITAWIAPSTGTVSGLLAASKGNLPRNRIFQIPHGTPLVGTQRPPKRREKRRIELLFCAALLPHKGIGLIPGIMARLIRNKTKFHFHIAGHGDGQKELAYSLASLGLEKHASFYGYLSRSDLIKLQMSCDLLVFPSQIEGFGLSLIEAMMTGLVPIATLLPGITDDIIEHGETGFLLADYSPKAFGDLITSLANDECSIDTISEKARHSAIKKYSLSKMAEEYIHLINIHAKT